MANGTKIEPNLPAMGIAAGSFGLTQGASAFQTAVVTVPASCGDGINKICSAAYEWAVALKNRVIGAK